MLLTVHVAVGAAIAHSFGLSNVWAFVVGFLSHFVIDMIPHGDQSLGRALSGTSDQARRIKKRIPLIVLADFFILSGLWVVITRIATQPLTPAIVIGGLGAMLPDALQALDIFWHVGRWYRIAHGRIHELTGAHVSFPVGMAIQAVTLAVASTIFLT